MRILIVDDEADVLQSIMAVVKAVPGHEVRVAANAQKAVDHAGTMGGVDLLITDVVMEPTDGFTLRAALQEAYPAMQTVFVSGYDLSDYPEQTAGAAVLAKPVDAMSLITEIGKAVGHTTAPAPAAVPEKARVAGKTTAITVPDGAKRTTAVTIAQAMPAPAAQPAVIPQVMPVATVVPTPSTAPRAMPLASAPAAVPQSGIAAQPRAAAADPLIGVQLGDYRVQQFIGDGYWGRVYLALQVSVNRRVGLKVLDPARSEDEGTRAQFLADARAKAAVQHPFIMSVFEADERNGLAFYTHEFLDGPSMEELIARGQVLDEKTALHVLKVAGEALQYLWSHNLSHAPVEAGSLRLGSDSIARMANIAVSHADPAVTVERELLTLGTVVRRLTQEEAISTGLRMLLSRMTGGPNPVTGWPVVLQAVKALEPKVIPVEAAKMKAADAAAMRAVEAARRARKRGIIINVCTLSALLGLLGFVVWKYAISNARRLDAQVQIPAGTYMVGSPADGNKTTLGAFEIDKYEVSIGEYAKFIAWCEQNSSREHEFDHPRGDRKKPHVNQEVKTLILNAAQRGKRVFKQDADPAHKQDADPAHKQEADPGVEVDLNSPIVGVTFWDAYAYAHWRGQEFEKGPPRDLPTEEEWEAAARGTKGYKYPWGDELKLGNFNSNKGYIPLRPGGTKPDDGYNYWAPVDGFTSDVSEFGVVGMAGNVCEWVYRKEGNKEIPLLKGGSFASDPIPMWGRILKIPAEDCWFVRPAADKKKMPPGAESETYFVGDDVTASFRSLYAGFRTVKRK
jgi:formylglycine-generating enzyme required for sulfatase activity/DNA-binding NarL/FixJ family response regulator